MQDVKPGNLKADWEPPVHQVPMRQKKKAKRLFVVEYRIRRDRLNRVGRHMQQLWGEWKVFNRYATERDRENVLRGKKSDDFFEYRKQPS